MDQSRNLAIFIERGLIFETYAQFGIII